MQSVSGAFTTATQDAGQRPLTYVEFSWDKTGAITASKGGAGWTNETTYLDRHNGTLHINPPGEKLIAAGSIGVCSIFLSNNTQRFSWKRTDGALYSYIGGATGFAGIPVRIWQGWVTGLGDEYVCIFTGMVKDWTENTAEGTVELQCADWGWKYLQAKVSTALSQDQLANEWIDTVATDAGIASGEMSLDIGIFQIPFVWMDDESPVEEIWDTAESDGGLAYFDQTGKLRYENALHWLGHSSVWTFSDGTYQLSEPRIQSNDVATKIEIEYAPRYVGPEVTVYEQETYRVVPPGETLTFVARFDYATERVFDIDADNDDYFVSSLGGNNITDQVTVTMDGAKTYAQQTSVTITNTSTVYSARIDSLRIRGLPLIGAPTEQVSADASPAPFDFERIRSVRGQIYMQTYEQAAMLAELLAVRCRRVRPTWRLGGAPGVPQLELLDVVTFQDEKSLGSGQSVSALVTDIRWEASSTGGFTQNITVMDITDWAEYSSYFIVGLDSLGASERIYY